MAKYFCARKKSLLKSKSTQQTTKTMKTKKLSILLSLAAALLGVTKIQSQTPFISGNLAVFQATSNASTNTSVSLLEVNASGGLEIGRAHV